VGIRGDDRFLPRPPERRIWRRRRIVYAPIQTAHAIAMPITTHDTTDSAPSSQSSSALTDPGPAPQMCRTPGQRTYPAIPLMTTFSPLFRQVADSPLLAVTVMLVTPLQRTL